VASSAGVCPARSSWKASAMVKQPAWAAAISSSGFVPFSLSKRVLNEYGVAARTPESLDSSPLPARPVPRQIALALRIMGTLLFETGGTGTRPILLRASASSVAEHVRQSHETARFC